MLEDVVVATVGGVVNVEVDGTVGRVVEVVTGTVESVVGGSVAEVEIVDTVGAVVEEVVDVEVVLAVVDAVELEKVVAIVVEVEVVGVVEVVVEAAGVVLVETKEVDVVAGAVLVVEGHNRHIILASIARPGKAAPGMQAPEGGLNCPSNLERFNTLKVTGSGRQPVLQSESQTKELNPKVVVLQPNFKEKDPLILAQ